MALLQSTLLCITLPWFYLTPLYSTLLYQGSTSLYLILHDSTMALLYSTLLYIILPWLYLILIDSAWLYHGSTSLYFILHYTNMALLNSTSLNIILPLLCSTLLDSTLLYHNSSSHYLTLIILQWIYFTLRNSTHNSTMAPLHSTSLYINLTLLYFTLLDSILPYIQWPYLTLLDSI